MKVFRDVNELPAFKSSVLTIGMFDGVHKGHQQILDTIIKLSKKSKGESILITFDPHPRYVLGKTDHTFKLITTLDEKIKLLEKYGLENLVVIPFTREFSERSPELYVKDFLVDKFSPSVIVIGYNHRFGIDRSGDIHLLKSMSEELSYDVLEIEQQTLDHIAISSTKIRNFLSESNVEEANKLLGHYFFLTGIVVKGKQLGRGMGYPTANIMPSTDKLIPADGIYAVVVMHQNKRYKGMMSIGMNPTIDGTQRTIEVNIFDFNEDIYGETLQVEFVAYLRQEKKFASLDDLKAQLDKDKVQALSAL